MRNDEGGKKENFGWGQVLVSGGGWWWLVILAGVEKGMWGSWNVLECLEQSGIIEWIWNKKRQTEVPRWKNVLLGRLKKHSIHSDSFTGPRTFLRWHHREYNPPPLSSSHLPTLLFLSHSSCLTFLTLQDKLRSSLIYWILLALEVCVHYCKVCQEWSSYTCLQILWFENRNVLLKAETKYGTYFLVFMEIHIYQHPCCLQWRSSISHIFWTFYSEKPITNI